MDLKTDSSEIVSSKSDLLSAHAEYRPGAEAFFLPAGMVAYGFFGMGHNPVASFDQSAEKKFNGGVQTFHTRFDNYLQYSPAAAFYCLHIAGVKGRHTVKDGSIILGMSMLISSGFVTSLKSLTHKERPDGTSYRSFPSGHTATAFVGAEFLRVEYKDVSPWYGIAGYLAATATGAMRVMNNRHWVSDVVAGAGFGILSTRLSYLIYDGVKQKQSSRKKKNATVLVPYYMQGAGGLSLYYSFGN